MPLDTPPVHAGIEVAGEAEAIKVTEGAEQVMVCVAGIVILGVAVFCVTNCDPAVIQPLLAVTV